MKQTILRWFLSFINQRTQKNNGQPTQKSSNLLQADSLKITEDRPVPEVVVKFEEKILYIDAEIGLKVRETPEVDPTNKNVIEVLKFGERVEVVEENGSWYKVNYRNGKRGWMTSQYLTNKDPKKSTSELKIKLSTELPIFEVGFTNLDKDENTKRLRKFIDKEFWPIEGSGVDLQCVEYVHYMVKLKTSIVIIWPADRPRDGGKWADIFKKYRLYQVSKEPTIYSAMSFTNPEFNKPWGHVAFVEDVSNDGTIRISEANFPSKGRYNTRLLSKEEWQQQKWMAEFIDFT